MRGISESTVLLPNERIMIDNIRHAHIVGSVYPRITVILAVLLVFASAKSTSASSIGAAKISGGNVSLTQKVVTTVYPPPGDPGGPAYLFYIQEKQGSGFDYSGIAVAAPPGITLHAGDLVDVSGFIFTSYPECILLMDNLNISGTETLPTSVYIRLINAAGSHFGHQEALYANTTTNPPKLGYGLNLVGCRVKVSGRIRYTGVENDQPVCLIDDGSGLWTSFAEPGLKLQYWPGCPAPVWQQGDYVWTVGVLSAEYGPGSLLVPVLQMDPTPPEPPTVTDDGTETASASRLHASWSASDPESGIARYEYAIGTSPGATDVLDWTDAQGATEVLKTGLSLEHGTTYYFSVRVTNGAGLQSTGCSDGIVVATIAPEISAPVFNNGTTIPQYGKFEASFTIDGLGTTFIDYNPFNPNPSTLTSDYWNLKGVCVDALLTSPSGRNIVWPCFYYQTSSNAEMWKLRFAPYEIGSLASGNPWRCTLRVSYCPGETCAQPLRAYSDEFTFDCVANTNPRTMRGFLKVSATDPKHFEFTDGSPFYPIGFDLTGYSGGNLREVASECLPKFEQYGANFSRILSTSTNIECDPNRKYARLLNDYREYNSDGSRSMARTRNIDAVIDTAHARGVYIEWCIDDWTYLKEEWDDDVDKHYTHNQYITNDRDGRPGPCSTVDEFWDGVNGAREIYKRKLRYWMARWGWASNLMCIELVNENGGSYKAKNWLLDMARFIHGDDSAVPESWGTTQDFDVIPKMVSSSNWATKLTEGNIPWSDPQVDFINYHDSGRDTIGWNSIYSNGSYYPLRKFGSTLDKPWMDMAVWVDRMGDLVHKQTAETHPGWRKPFSWTEFGLMTTGSSDWTAAYQADTTGRHYRDAIWAGLFANISIAHWKLDYIGGNGSFTAGGEKYWIAKPLSNFVSGEDLRTLVQQTAPGDAAPGRLECSNANVQAMVLAGSDKAYLYVNNTTDTWYYYCVGTTGVPVPAPQTASVKIKGLTPGSYKVERWNTYDTNPATQKRAEETRQVTSNGELLINVSLGITDDDRDDRYDAAYKIKRIGD